MRCDLTHTGYDALGRRTRRRDHDGGRFTYAYDDNSRLTVVRNPQDQRSSFACDAGDRRTVIRLGNGTRTSLAYDAQNQLLGEHRTGTNAYRQTFAYDPAGNRTLKNADGVRTTFNYDAANQLTYSLAAAGRTTYGYDAAGNQRIEQPPAGARTTTTWDYENQPTQYRLPTGSPVTMTYNSDNRRVQSQQSTTVPKFVWNMPTDAYLSELDSANATQVVYPNEPVYYGSVISQRRGSTTHWLHADALGFTRILTTSAGASSDTYLYDAWGNPITSSGPTVNPFRWVGRYGYYFDTVTGQYYIRTRKYQPTVARWTSGGPIASALIYLYVYGQLGSLDFVEPSGSVDLKITPTSPDSMPWHDVKLERRDEVGHTVVVTEEQFKIEMNSQTLKCRCRFTLEGTARIEIDVIKTATMARTIKGLTLQNRYGHEQKHVENFITIMKWGEQELNKIEAPAFDSSDAAKNKCDEELKRVGTAIKETIALDGQHKGKDPKSPGMGKFTPYPPIRTMPDEPEDEPYDLPKVSEYRMQSPRHPIVTRLRQG